MPAKEFTSFDVAATVRELKTLLPSSHVNNIYQLDAGTVQLKLHKPDEPAIWLILEAGRRVNLTAYTSEKPSRPSAFCMALRKYLRNARLLDVEQYEFERIVVLSFKAEEGGLRLVLELFGEGNVILVGGTGKILQALIYKRMRDRNVLRGEPFSFPPPLGGNPLKIEKGEFTDGLRSTGMVEVVRALARFLSIGGMYAEEVLSRAGVDKTRFSNALSDHDIDAIFKSLKDLLSQVVKGALEPFVVSDQAGKLIDVVPLRLLRYESQAYSIKPYGKFNEAMDEFYVKVSIIEQARGSVEVERLRAEAARLERIISDQQEAVTSARSQAEQNKNIGNFVYKHYSELHTVLERFATAQANHEELNDAASFVVQEKQKGVYPWVLFKSYDKKEFAVEFCGEGLDFKLNPKSTLFQSAAEFYQRSKRAKQKLNGAQAALNDSSKKLEEVKNKISKMQRLETEIPAETTQILEKRKMKRKEWFEKFRWFVSSDGFLVVSGKDAVSNEVLVKKYTEPSDVVFHADIVGAPFVTVKTEEKKPSEQSLRQAGEFAAAFSRAWREGFASVDVYWVKPEQLSKGGPSGESVARGAFVVRGQRNWMRRIPLRIAVGLVSDEETGVVATVGGPVEAVKSKTSIYAIVVPGDLEGKDLFRRVLKNLSGKASQNIREAISILSVEAVREYVPFGRGTISEH